MTEIKPTDESTLNWLTLSLTPHISTANSLKLVEHFGTISSVMEQNQATLAQVINPKVAKLISEKSALPDVEKALQWESSSNNHHIINIESRLYPRELTEMRDPPLVLYAIGNIDLLKNEKLAIVGTRHPSIHGVEHATNFAHEISKHQFTVVSGMALGVDRHAHIGGLRGSGLSIGVLGTGIDQVYPRSNKDLFQQMIDYHGLLLSEYPLKMQPLAYNFPKRNRIIAGLSKGCLVVESNIDGGSMITANLALEMGREVMAIPGSINNPATRGCHKLIKSGAKLVENIGDILDELKSGLFFNKPNNIPIGKTTNPILSAMGFEPIAVDKICNQLNLSVAEICPKLVELELDGQIVNCGSGQYQRVCR